MDYVITASPSLNNLLTTNELSKRPSRPPDFEAVNQAFVSLLTAGLRSPESILQRYAELLLPLCDAHSSGVSILEIANGEEIFRWHAIAGRYAAYRWGTMPRYASPCGVILHTKGAQLFKYPDRHFPYSIPLSPPICEALLTPFQINGEDVIGTTWVIAHEQNRKFDYEDLRRMQTFARFTSISYDLAVKDKDKRGL